MPFLQSSGAISIANLNSFFPGSGTSMSNFYRGGGRVPATKTTTQTITESPAFDFNFYWVNGGGGPYLVWAGVNIYGNQNDSWRTSVTIGIWTYYPGAYSGYSDPTYGIPYYNIYRQRQASQTVNINTGIPSSGQISLSQFYGAETP
jgi:hypothetical protein